MPCAGRAISQVEADPHYRSTVPGHSLVLARPACAGPAPSLRVTGEIAEHDPAEWHAEEPRGGVTHLPCFLRLLAFDSIGDAWHATDVDVKVAKTVSAARHVPESDRVTGRREKR